MTKRNCLVQHNELKKDMDPGAKLSFFKSQHLLAKEVSFRKVT